MEPITITKTKDYLILKIPTKALKYGRKDTSSNEKKIIQEGLNALEKGRVSKPFKTAREAIVFLRSL